MHCSKKEEENSVSERIQNVNQAITFLIKVFPLNHISFEQPVFFCILCYPLWALSWGLKCIHKLYKWNSNLLPTYVGCRTKINLTLSIWIWILFCILQVTPSLFTNYEVKKVKFKLAPKLPLEDIKEKNNLYVSKTAWSNWKLCNVRCSPR